MSKTRKVGPFTVRPYTKNGIDTGRWFLDIPPALTGNGKRKRKLFDNQRKALDVARELRRRIDPVTGSLITPRQNTGLTYAQALPLWKDHETLRVKTLKKRASTHRAEQCRARTMERYFRAYHLSAITERDIIAYQASRLAQNIKPVTINAEVALLLRFLRWARKHGYIQAIPEIEQIPVRPVKIDTPTPAEVVRLINALPVRLQPFVRFLAETGCRVGEAINLTWDCVDEINGSVEITSKDGWTPKTLQSERTIPLNPSLLEMIRQLPKDTTYVFPTHNADAPIKDFTKAFRAAVTKANITRKGKPIHITPKTLRKAHATWQAERGVNESVLQGLLGHARGSKITRQFYIHTTEEAKKAAVITLPFTKKTGS